MTDSTQQDRAASIPDAATEAAATTETPTCGWCGEPIEPTPDGQRLYCGPQHKRLAKMERYWAKPAHGTPERLALAFKPTGPQACEWCDALFVPTTEVQKYCKPVHAKRARLARNKLRDLGEGMCPRPDKIAHKSEKAAELRLLRLKRPDLEVYRCRCGDYHIGHIYPAGHDLRGGNYTSPEAVRV